MLCAPCSLLCCSAIVVVVVVVGGIGEKLKAENGQVRGGSASLAHTNDGNGDSSTAARHIRNEGEKSHGQPLDGIRAGQAPDCEHWR